MIDENVELARDYKCDPKRPKENTCPIQVPVYDVARVEIAETFGNIQ